MNKANISTTRIEQLSADAARHGDLVQVAVCAIALGQTIHDIAEEYGPAIHEELANWDHPWANQIRTCTEGAQALARVLCYQALSGQP